MIEEQEYDVEKIKEYLLKNPDYFREETKADAIDDVMHFKTRKPNHIIFYGEYFLCDIYAGEMWIVRLLEKKKYNRKRKTWLRIEAVGKVIDCFDENGKRRFSRFNGYWIIPDLVFS